MQNSVTRGRAEVKNGHLWLNGIFQWTLFMVLYLYCIYISKQHSKMIVSHYIKKMQIWSLCSESSLATLGHETKQKARKCREWKNKIESCACSCDVVTACWHLPSCHSLFPSFAICSSFFPIELFWRNVLAEFFIEVKSRYLRKI